MWNTHVNLIDVDLDAIAKAGKVALSARQRSDLKAKIETYATLAEAEKDTPAVCGSGGSCDFIEQHHVNLKLHKLNNFGRRLSIEQFCFQKISWSQNICC